MLICQQALRFVRSSFLHTGRLYKGDYSGERKGVTLNVSCFGCGARLQCKDKGNIGFVSSDRVFRAISEQRHKLRVLNCDSCGHGKDVDDPGHHRHDRIIQELSKPLKERSQGNKRPLLLLVADLAWLPRSVLPQWASLPKEVPTFLIGNKIDIFPRDSTHYLKRLRECLLEAAQRLDLEIDYCQLISARTGFRLEELVSQILKRLKGVDSIQILGAVNSGKSELFNRLLNSDLCNALTVRRTLPATVSNWPGTTVGLLKFPVRKVTSQLLGIRGTRLKDEGKLNKIKNSYRARLSLDRRNEETSTLTGSLSTSDDSEISLPAGQYSYSGGSISEFQSFDDVHEARSHVLYKRSLEVNNDELTNAKWCVDTPGYLGADMQMLRDNLSAEELDVLKTDCLVEPIMMKVAAGQTIMVGGLLRVDLIQVNDEGSTDVVHMHVFCSPQLPVLLCRTEDADDLYRDRLGNGQLVVPQNEPGPELACQQITLSTQSRNLGDIVLHGVGWINVRGQLQNSEIKLNIHTPFEKLLFMRETALLQHLQPKHRIGDTPVYMTGIFHPYHDAVSRRQKQLYKEVLRKRGDLP